MIHQEFFGTLERFLNNSYRNDKVKALLKKARDFAIKDIDKPTKSIGKIISKIKK